MTACLLALLAPAVPVKPAKLDELITAPPARSRDDGKDMFQAKKDTHDVHVEHAAKVGEWI
jgi:hypothetical protein